MMYEGEQSVRSLEPGRVLGSDYRVLLAESIVEVGGASSSPSSTIPPLPLFVAAEPPQTASSATSAKSLSSEPVEA